jgi:predicted Holliday junction resolvase-like endonuclease
MLDLSTLLLIGVIVVLALLFYIKSKKLNVSLLKEVHLSTYLDSLNRTISSLQGQIEDYNKTAASLKVDIHSLRKREEQLILLSQEREDHLSKHAQSLNATIVQLQEHSQQLSNNISDLQKQLKDSYSVIPKLANEQAEEFKKNHINQLKESLQASAKQSALADLESWKIQYEAFFRQDAISRSQSVIMGKVTEHLIPFQNSFPFNPKEARFIGSPIDLIVFDGIDNEDIVDIYILEIKTGDSSLSKRQRLIKDAVQNGRVHWRELRY